MAFTLPSLEETRQQTSTDIESWLKGTEARTRRSTLGVIAFSQAGAVNGLHAHIDYLHRNFLPDEQADAEGVERWARRYGLWYRVATFAKGPVVVTGNSGAELPAGSLLQFTQDLVYATTSDIKLTGLSALVDVEAQTSGKASNLAAGARVTLLSPVPGISSVANVADTGIAGGEDAGDLDDLRAQVYRRMSEPPQGGSLADYETWALASHVSITRAWATEHEQGAGSVTVRIVCDNNLDPIPVRAVLDTCEAYIDLRRPAGRRSIYVVPPVATPVNYRIQVVPNTAQVRAAVEAELRDLHRREAQPGGSLLLSHIREVVSLAAGETDNSVLYPTENIVMGVGRLAVFGGIEWA